MEVNPNPNFSDKAKEDYALVLQASKHGSEKAYAELMARYKDSIFFMLLKMVNNREDAMDLTIETFGKAFENIEKYKPEYAFSTWLFKIGVNNCIDFIRKKKLKTFSIDETYDNDGEEVTFDLPSNAINPEDSFIKKQKSDILHNLVTNLPARYQRLVYLRYFEEKAYEEIAEELQLPLGTVKAQLFRARDLLFHILRRNRDKI